MTRKEFFKLSMLEAEDIDQQMQWERDFATCGLAHGDGKPPTSMLVYLWQRARALTERTMRALPCGPLRDELAYFLQERDEAMARLRAVARADLHAKLAEGGRAEQARRRMETGNG